MACCSKIRISSHGKVKEMYPFVLGIYEKMDTKDSQNIFVKSDLPEEMFLIQPKTTEWVWGHTWVVSQSDEATRGYIRSTGYLAFPNMAGRWMVYYKNMKTWDSDYTLRAFCI